MKADKGTNDPIQRVIEEVTITDPVCPGQVAAWSILSVSYDNSVQIASCVALRTVLEPVALNYERTRRKNAIIAGGQLRP